MSIQSVSFFKYLWNKIFRIDCILLHNTAIYRRFYENLNDMLVELNELATFIRLVLMLHLKQSMFLICQMF